MLIRRRSPEFNKISKVILENAKNPKRKQKIRLYSLNHGSKVNEMIPIDHRQTGGDFFYNLNYDSIKNSLSDPDYLLHESDERPGLYFFHRKSDRITRYAPFEIKKSTKSAAAKKKKKK